MAKLIVPSMALQVIDRAIQSFGAEGISQDTPLAKMWAGLRTLRFADVRFFSLALLISLARRDAHCFLLFVM